MTVIRFKVIVTTAGGNEVGIYRSFKLILQVYLLKTWMNLNVSGLDHELRVSFIKILRMWWLENKIIIGVSVLRVVAVIGCLWSILPIWASVPTMTSMRAHAVLSVGESIYRGIKLCSTSVWTVGLRLCCWVRSPLLNLKVEPICIICEHLKESIHLNCPVSRSVVTTYLWDLWGKKVSGHQRSQVRNSVLYINT